MEPLKNSPHSLAVYSVIPHPDGKDTYLRIGGGHGDLGNAGLTLQLDAIPLHGKVLVRTCELADRSLSRRRSARAAV